MYAIYATDANGRLAGVLSLRELLAAAPGAKISDIAWTSEKKSEDESHTASLVDTAALHCSSSAIPSSARRSACAATRARSTAADNAR